ncbi:MAG: DUF3800 domain-containing protein [Thermotogota bacterium]|nr:DUF3800 domain-containing protein [Thermotogota bacterium]
MKKNVFTTEYNIYCDESCHLENDGISVMALGGVWCEKDKIRQVFQDLKMIKIKYDVHPNLELKWVKVSMNKIDLYLEIIDYFRSNPFLNFRGLLIPDKSLLKHKEYNQDHDTWYYKMYYTMLKILLKKEASFNVYLDMKNTKGGPKTRKLKEILNIQSNHSLENKIRKIQIVQSHEVQILQITDLLIGALCYNYRGLMTSEAKLEIIKKIKGDFEVPLDRTSPLSEEKLNILVWGPIEWTSQL